MLSIMWHEYWEKIICNEIREHTQKIWKKWKRKKQAILQEDCNPFVQYCISNNYINPLFDIALEVLGEGEGIVSLSLWDEWIQWSNTETYIYILGSNDYDLHSSSQLIKWYTNIHLYRFIYTWRYKTFLENMMDARLHDNVSDALRLQSD